MIFTNCDLLKNYEISVNNQYKTFCPNCFRVLTTSLMNKHFIGCSEVPSCKKISGEDERIIAMSHNDILFRGFLKKFNKFLRLYTNEIRNMPYNKNYFYWILQHKDSQFGTLTIGLAYVRFKEDLDRFVLSAIVVFPWKNTGRGYGTWFIKKINNYYKQFGGIIIESPNPKSLSLAKKLGIDYYHHP